MEIKVSDKDPRIFFGTYHTAVGTAQQRDYSLAGACDTAGGTSQTLGWVVAFDPPDPSEPGEPPNAPTTCAWSGQRQVVGEGEEAFEYLNTSWYLTGPTEHAADWESTQSGKNYFFRAKPSSEILGRAILA